MKTNVLGIKSKYFLVILFVLFLFAHYGNGQVISDIDEADADKELVACEYGSGGIQILGNTDCSNMFCMTWGVCTDEDSKRKSYSMLCSADQNPDGSWTCPGAYACAVDEDHEYHEAFVTRGNVIFNSDCEGAGFLNKNTGEWDPFPLYDDRNPPLIDPVTNSPSGELYPLDEVEVVTPPLTPPEDTPRTPDPATNSPPVGN